MSSLIAFCHLRLYHNDEDGELHYDPLYGTVSDIGLADDSDLSNLSRPPRVDHPPLDGWVSDKFMQIEPGERLSALGHANLEETRAYDNMMRGELEATGLKLSLTLIGPACQAYCDYIGNARQVDYRDPASWDGGLAVIIPCAPFEFPAQRVTRDPWSSSPSIGNLEPIVNFNFQTLSVFKLVGTKGNRLTSREALLTGFAQLGQGFHLPMR